MRKDTTTAKLTKIEVERNKKISKKRYIAAPCGINLHRMEDPTRYYLNNREKTLMIAESIPRGKKQYFGLSHLHDGFRLVEPPRKRGRP
jgi:hypothetical protein